MIKGDKIKLIHPMGAFTNVGEICEVTDVAEGGVISFKFGNGLHLGCMSYDEYEKYFEKVEKPIKKEWSEWKIIMIGYTNLDDELVRKNVQYRENGKRIQIKYNDVKATSSCHAGDVFDLTKGLELATRRFIIKLLIKETNELASKM